MSDIGSVMDTMISNTILENLNNLKFELKADHQTVQKSGETYVVQGDDEDRIGAWRSMIRQEFARKRSLVFYVPTIEEAKNLSSALTRGIEGYLFTLHNKISKKDLARTWKTLTETDHPIVIVATPSFSVLPRNDIYSVIIERENGRGWINERYPYVDGRRALEMLSRTEGKSVYLADIILRVETLNRLNNQEISQGSPFKWRSVSLASDVLIDMKRDIRSETANVSTDISQKEFRVISPELEELIRYNQEESSHLFILTIRRGTSPVTVCNDCETIVQCRQCSSPVVLHSSSTSGKNFFMCHHCGERRSADESCVNCKGWRLVPLGIGIDKVRDEISRLFPTVDVFKIDADETKTEAQIKSAINGFKEKPGSILLGTEMALTHLDNKIDHIAISSLDSLFALPDFRIQEKIMHILVRLRALAVRTFLVQTRRTDEKVFEYGLKGNLSDFLRTTLDDRQKFSYPPYASMIKITIDGKKDSIAERMVDVQNILTPREIDIFPAFTATIRGQSIIHGLLKLPRGGWPNTDLLNKLKSLPLDVKIKVDPESLL